MQFNLEARDGLARAGRLQLSGNRSVRTPVFMPVGTQASVKTLTSRDLHELGVEMILSNAYHLYLRPGADLIREIGGLHKFMGWPGGIITDSGGFQVFSLSHLRKITDDGVEFTSHWDGSRHVFTPESNMQLQHALGADIIMALDVCVKYPAEADEIRRSVELTTHWARRCRDEHEKNGENQSLFGIIQGGINEEAREKSLHDLRHLDFPGYGIGGLSVGEGSDLMRKIILFLESRLPEEKPRYLMGVGTPYDLWDAVACGIDMMDCAMPTRIARNGTLFTSRGRLVIRNAAYARDGSPPDPDCGCLLCANHSRAYLRHLFNVHEVAALRLSTLHNITFMLQLAEKIQDAIRAGQFTEARREFEARYAAGTVPAETQNTCK